MIVPNIKFSELLVTHPVLLLSSRSGRSNTVAPLTWYMPVSLDPPLIAISLKPSALSWRYVRESGDFILAVPGESMLKAVQFCGVHSGRDMDKIHHLGLQTAWGKAASPLMLTGCMANIECRTRDIHQTGARPLIVGEILSIYADEIFYKDGWRPNARLIYYAGGNRYRIDNEIIDMGHIRPGYVPPI